MPDPFTAKSALNLLRGRVAERKAWLHEQAASEGMDDALVAADALDEVLTMIDQEIARLDEAM